MSHKNLQKIKKEEEEKDIDWVFWLLIGLGIFLAIVGIWFIAVPDNQNPRVYQIEVAIIFFIISGSFFIIPAIWALRKN
jgi:heme A synthase